jgi:hypothetical protein
VSNNSGATVSGQKATLTPAAIVGADEDDLLAAEPTNLAGVLRCCRP